MKYFEVFELDPRLNIDLEALERKFHALSRKYHPDFFANATGEERAHALQMTALLNDAYRTLRDATRRAHYLLEASGCKVDGSKVPQSLLMEVFEINEGLDQFRSTRQSGGDVTGLLNDMNALRERVAEKRTEFENALQTAFDHWDALLARGATESEQRAHLEALADILSQAAYIRNLEHDLEEEVSR